MFILLMTSPRLDDPVAALMANRKREAMEGRDPQPAPNDAIQLYCADGRALIPALGNEAIALDPWRRIGYGPVRLRRPRGSGAETSSAIA